MIWQTLICDGRRVDNDFVDKSERTFKRVLYPYRLISDICPVHVLEKGVHVYSRRFRMDHSNIAWVIATPIPISLLESSKEGRTRGDLYIEILNAERLDTSRPR